MLGTYVNTIAILIGTITGIILKKKINQDLNKSLFDLIAIVVLVVGIDNSLKMTNPIIVILSLVIGAIIGELLRIEARINEINESISRKNINNNVFKAFINATLIFCVGSMSIYGAIQSGVSNNHETLYIKSVLDGITSMILSSTLGIGVIFSSIVVFVYQGTITILASSITEYLSASFVNNLSGVGGILLIGIALNMLKLYNFKILNYIPSFVVLALVYWLL